MAGLSNYTKKSIRSFIWSNFLCNISDSLCWAIHYSTIDDGLEELSQVPAHMRVSVLQINTTNWPNATGGDPFKGKRTIFTFPTATADWGTIVGVGIFDASSSGNLLAYESFLGTAYLYHSNCLN